MMAEIPTKKPRIEVKFELVEKLEKWKSDLEDDIDDEDLSIPIYFELDLFSDEVLDKIHQVRHEFVETNMAYCFILSKNFLLFSRCVNSS